MPNPGSGIKDGKFIAMSRCFFCLEAGEILLHQRFGDISAMHDKVVNMHPCSKCQDLMKQGILIISVMDGQYDDMEKQREEHNRWRDRQLSDSYSGYRKREQDVPGFIPNPYRTGVVVVMKEEAFERVFNDGMTPGLIEKVKRHRWTFMEDSVCELTHIYDMVDKPDEVPFRVECRKKGLDPRKYAVEIARGKKPDDAEKEAVQTDEEDAPAAGQDSPGGLPSVDADHPDG